MHNTFKSEVSGRIDLLRYLLIGGIVFLHTPPYVPLNTLPADAEAFSLMKAFVQNVLFRLSVPTLAAISGYLMFRDTHFAFRELAAKKAKTILLPMIAWNVIAFGALFAAGALTSVTVSGSGSTSQAAYPFDLWKAVDGIFGITGSLVWNYPLNFLRDLFVLVLLAPVVAFLLKHSPYLGLVLWSAVFFFNLEGALVTRASMPITFFIGALAATRRWDLLALDRYRAVALGALLAACLAVLAFRVADQRLFRTLAPLAVWPAASLLMNTHVARFMIRNADASFFIFLSHAFVLKAYALIFDRLADWVPQYVSWIAAPIATIATCQLLYRCLCHMAPGAFGWLVGGRIGPRRANEVPERSVVLDAQ